MTLVFLMLCSGLFQTAASNQLRLFHNSTGDKKLNEAKSYCSNWNGELATLFDDDDAELAKWVLQHKGAETSQAFWIGLRRTGVNAIWSDGTAFASDMPGGDVEVGELQKCLTTQNWTRFKCSDSKPFICYNSTGPVLIEIEKNWCQAQWHCKRYYTDLVNVSEDNQSDLLELGKNRPFWTGLMHDQWQWPKNECSTYRTWEPTPTESDEECAVLNLEGMKTYGCRNKASALCSKGDLRVNLVNISKTWEEALDYCKENHEGMLLIKDKDDQDAVKQQLGFILNKAGASGPLWIGLRQSSLFGFWIWKESVVIYSNWNETRKEVDLPSHHCGVIDPTDNYLWSPENCLQRLFFLCQEKIHSWRENNDKTKKT